MNKNMFQLTSTQYGIYLEEMNMGDSTLYHLPFLGIADKDVDPERFAAAIRKAVQAHPALTAVLKISDDGTVTEEFTDTPADVKIVRLSDEEFEERKKNLVRPFDMNGGELSRFELYVTPSRTWVFDDLHHVIADGTSFHILAEDICKAYDGEPIEKETSSHAQALTAENEFLSSAESAKAEKFWDDILSDYDGDSCPERDVWEDTPSQGRLELDLDIDNEKLRTLRHKAGCSTTSFFNAVMAQLLSVYCGSDDVMYNTISSARNEENKRTIGMYVRTYPVRVDFLGIKTVEELLHNVHCMVMEGRENSAYPYIRLAEKYKLRNRVTFAYEGTLSNPVIADKYVSCVESLYNEKRIESDAFRVEIRLGDDGAFHMYIGYRKDQYSDGFAQAFARTYAQIASEFLCRTELADVKLVSPYDIELLEKFNRTDADWECADIVTLFRRQAAKTPDNTAVVFKDKRFTYREVDEITDRIAAYLHAHGVSRGSFVPVLILRCEYMVIASIGILKSGAAYQPLDPSYPSERLEFMISDSSAKVIIAERSLMSLIPGYGGEVLYTDEIPDLPEAGELPESPEPEDAFILLYTSGSTGIPKGVILEHRNFCNFSAWYRRYFDLSENSRVSAYASYGFDACQMEMYPALTTGAGVCIIPEEIRLDFPALQQFFDKHGITHGFMTTQVGRQFSEFYTGTTLKVLIVGGESLTPVHTPGKSFTLYNGYGPTECTVMATIYPVDRLYHRVPIGSPLGNYRLFIADKNGRRLPLGAPGELWISGRGVAREYLNRPEKTAEVFVNNTFSELPEYKKAYRTGDIVRQLPDGNYDIIGRADGQVKIRGFRIELTEVEAVIREFPEVKDATVAAFENPDGAGKYLAAYIVGESIDKPIDIEALNAFIAQRKPPYMVPAVTMQIDKIPLNQNQKVNKKALPKPEINPGRSKKQAVAAPLNDLEKELSEITAEIVGTSDFGITDPFRDLGLTSISSIRLATSIYKRYGVQVKSQQLASQGCIQSVENEIISALLSKDRNADTVAQHPESTAFVKRSCKLTFEQQGVYAECQANPEAVRYNVPFELKFPEGITAERLEEAIRKVTAAHPYIFCRFTSDRDGEIIQEPIPNFKLSIPVLTMSAEEYMSHRAEFVRPFDLSEGPLVRFEIIRSDTLRLLADMHHLVSDGSSLDLFFRQLCEVLNGADIEPEDYDYYEYAAEETVTPEAEAFFSKQLSGVDEVTHLIPDVFEEGLPHSLKSVTVKTSFAAVKELAGRVGITPAAVYLAASALTYGRYLCEDTASIATISNGRSNVRIGNTMGMFVNTLPLVIPFDNKEKTTDYLQRTAQIFSDTVAHEHYPFARIAAKYDFRPAATFTYQIGVINDYRVGGESISTESLQSDIPKFPVGIYIDGTEENAYIRVDYDSAMYSEAMMLGLAKSVENVAVGMTASETLAGVSLTNDDEWKILDSFNPTIDLKYNREDSVVTAFRRTAAMFPDKEAAVFKNKSYTYRELDELTDKLAAKLYKHVCGITGKTSLAEEVVAILLPRDENVFILPLAVVKAGLAYEPLDPSYPKERLNFMVKDAGAVLLLSQDELAGLIDEYDGAVLKVSELYAMEDSDAVPEAPAPNDLFIMLYTSGSTGTPKGCQIEHRNLVAYAHGLSNVFCTRNDRTGAYASFGFDVNMEDVFCTLLNGGTVCLIPDDVRMDLGKLAEYFDEAGVTALLLTTQVGVQFIKNYSKLKTLRLLVMGGEKLPAVDPSSLSYSIANGYGPTENCCGVSTFTIHKWEPNIPIGKPFPTINAFVLDKTGHRLPAGAAGEYCLSGPQVTRGYLNRPDKTAEAYEQCPFNEYRMYHTGDIVRYRQNGDVEFVGRKDGQVKIRGFRVETKEVEAVIRSYSGISDVTVQAFDYEGGGKYLAAYVVSGTALDINKLREYIKELKPAYMVPAAIMQIDKIPLTVNQKVDKKALPAPKLQKAEYVAPAGKTEEDLCAVFGSVLGLDRVSAEDDFFDAGGSSILAMKVVIAAGKAGYSIVYNDVFKYTTPRALARFVDTTADKPTQADEPTAAADNVSMSSELPEIGEDGYDYRRIHALLERNTTEAYRSGKRLPLGDVLLLGATGYLGSHVLRELILHHDKHIFCFVRRNKDKRGEQRLKEILHYYFGQEYDAVLGSRVSVIEGDATDPEALQQFRAESDNMIVINCAASVKHFAKGDEIERINVGSVRNLTAWCEANDAKLVHISTGSVAGRRKNGMPPKNYRLDEHRLYAGQEIESNQYIRSKFLAERHIYEEVLEHGLRAKVLRVGNLAPRESDGEFQINYSTNNYMNTLRAFAKLGKISIDTMSVITDFSPIDMVSKAVLALAVTPDECICFIPMNLHRPLMSDVIFCLRDMGHQISAVDDDEFAQALQAALADEEKSGAVGSLIAYNGNDDAKEIGFDGIDNTYTTNILGRLGFFWPETGTEYIRRFLEKLEQKAFFGGEEK